MHIDVPAYLAAVAEGRFSDALGIIMERNPLPAVCGRVCLRPCEEGCRRCLLDDPVAIAAIKRAAADHGIYPPAKPDRPRPESVGVVGSGPAGLTVAHDLAQMGYSVTIYEERDRLGGMLRYGIPEYRLPDVALDRDIDHILSLGVAAVTGVRVGRDVSLEELGQRHQAVVVCIGLQGSRPLPIPGADLPQVLTALPFLQSVAGDGEVALGDRVVVIGGGNVAMDVARTAVRVGASDVTAVCIESRDEMPASEHEVTDAEQEGVRVVCSFGPAEIVGEDAVRGVRFKSCLSVFDEDGRFAPAFDEEACETLPADTVIFAVGQSADTEGLGLPAGPRGLLELSDPQTLEATPRVFVAGDAVSGPTKVIDAIAAGHRAAAAVVGRLRGDWTLLENLDAESSMLGEVPKDVASKLETRRRVEMERLEFYEAKQCYAEVELGYTEYEAAREAQRCLSCTTGARLQREKCAACLTCTRVCPHGAPVFQPGGYPYFAAEACHACGACAAECPAGAISIEGCSDAELSRRVERHLAFGEPDQVLAFVCGYTPDLLDTLGENAHIVTVPCLLRVSERVVFEAIDLGARHVVFTACHAKTCRFPHAIDIVRRRVEHIRALAAEIGVRDLLIVAGEASEDEQPGARPGRFEEAAAV